MKEAKDYHSQQQFFLKRMSVFLRIYSSVIELSHDILSMLYTISIQSYADRKK